MFNLKIRQFSAEGDKSCICRLSSLDSVCSQKWQVQIMTWILKNRTIHLLPYAIWKRVKIHIWATIHMKALFKIFLLIYNVNSFTSWAEYQLSFNKVFGFFLCHGYLNEWTQRYGGWSLSMALFLRISEHFLFLKFDGN